jgi:exo-beta-1,3-glucanase (GH17 family)
MKFETSQHGISRKGYCLFLAALAALLLAGCGGGADGFTGAPPYTKPTYPNNYTLALRPLPAIYSSTVKAINYSAYRAGGPGANEIPSDAQILEDLTLLNSAGYTLLRIFDTDISHENILRVAAAHFPAMKFHLGIYLAGIATADQAACYMPANDIDIQNGIREAAQYTNVVTVSVGNETSFFGGYMPVHCLKDYITTVKKNVSQPVTADDDYTFYAGLSGASELPDSILPLLDFVSMHTYPMSNPTRWTYSGTGSAAAMMNAALTNAQDSYTQVANYISTHGAAANLPIVVGETGWKAVVTNAPNPLESCCANPVNAKMYFDSMNTWQTGATGPLTVFYFEATDEAWKGNDDGWGLWDANRTPRYALCGNSGVTSAPACDSPLYANATFAQ